MVIWLLFSSSKIDSVTEITLPQMIFIVFEISWYEDSHSIDKSGYQVNIFVIPPRKHVVGAH